MGDIFYVYLTPSFSFVIPKDMFSIDGGRVYAWGVYISYVMWQF